MSLLPHFKVAIQILAQLFTESLDLRGGLHWQIKETSFIFFEIVVSDGKVYANEQCDANTTSGDTESCLPLIQMDTTYEKVSRT